MVKNMTERRMRLLAGLLAVCTVAASVTGCMKPNRMGAAGGGENSGPAPVKVEIMAQAEYPQEPVYKNDEERYEARYAREIPERFEEAYGSFALRTASQVLGKGSQVNQIYSPLGLYYALAMSAQGAARGFGGGAGQLQAGRFRARQLRAGRLRNSRLWNRTGAAGPGLPDSFPGPLPCAQSG